MIFLKILTFAIGGIILLALIEFQRPLTKLFFRLATPKLQSIKHYSLKHHPSPFEQVSPELWVAESANAFVIRDIKPRAPHHYLVIPKQRINTLNDASNELLAEMMGLAKQVAIESDIAEQGYRIVINTNPHGLQTVYHLHMHVLGGRQMGLPIG